MATRNPPGRPATILYLHSSDDLYGADRILLHIVQGLDRSRFTPLVVLPSDMRHVGLLARELEQSGIEWMHLPIAVIRRRDFNPLGMLRWIGRLVQGSLAIRRIIRERDVKLIHGFTFAVVNAPLAAKLSGIPLIMHAHEIILDPPWFRKALHAWNVRSAARVLCVSNATRNNILRDQPAAANRLQVIHNGIDITPPSGRSPAEIRISLGLDPDRPVVGMIGRISAWKGQELFLEAASRVLTTHPDCQFIAIGGVFDGDIDRLHRLQALHASLNLGGSFVLSDFRKDARADLPAFDIFVLPSTLPDPFPTVVLEAMSAHIPVIASAHGGVCEMVVDGETGLLVPPANSDALAQAIDTLLQDPALRIRMANAAHAQMLQNFELKRFLGDIQQTYESVLRSH